MQLQPESACRDLLAQRFRLTGGAYAQKTQVNRITVGSLEHSFYMPRTRRASGGKCPVRGTGAASNQGGDPGSERIVDLLRADEMNVSVDPSCGDMFPSPAITSVPGPITIVTPGWISGLPALPMAEMRPFLIPMSAFKIPL